MCTNLHRGGFTTSYKLKGNYFAVDTSFDIKRCLQVWIKVKLSYFVAIYDNTICNIRKYKFELFFKLMQFVVPQDILICETNSRHL